MTHSASSLRELSVEVPNQDSAHDIPASFSNMLSSVSFAQGSALARKHVFPPDLLQTISQTPSLRGSALLRFHVFFETVAGKSEIIQLQQIPSRKSNPHT